MKIKLISDTHFEFFEDPKLYQNPDNADVLVIAGDLAVGYDKCWAALERFADNHANVVYVPGNHEYYRGDLETFDAKLKQFSKGTNIHFLNPGKVTIQDVTFVGACLWTNFGGDGFARVQCGTAISDFRVIKGFNTHTCSDTYYEHVEYIEKACAAKGTKIVVTHFLPDQICVHPRYKTSYSQTLNSYFANNLGERICRLDNVPYWLFGHTHDNVDEVIGDTRLIANPYGYNENSNYTARVIEV